MRAEDRDRVRHMVEAASAVGRFIAGRGRADIDADEQLRFALLQAIQIIGEAASRVGTETRDALPAIPWRDIIDMRNRLVHAYFDIDHEILWKTASEEVPQLLAELREIPLK